MRRELRMQCIAASIIVIVLGGCVGNAVRSPATSISDTVQRENASEMYLWLSKAGDRWVFDDKLYLTPGQPSTVGVAIALSNFEAVDLNKNAELRIICFPIVNLISDGGCGMHDVTEKIGSPPPFGPFYTKSLNMGMTALLNTFGVFLTMGIATGGHSVSYFYDDEAYRKALHEAVNTSGLTAERRAAIFRGYVDIVEANNQSFQSLQQAYSVAQARHDHATTWSRSITDKSGLWKISDEDSVSISVRVPKLTEPTDIGTSAMLDRYVAGFGHDPESIISDLKNTYSIQAEKLRQDWAKPKEFVFICDHDGRFAVEIECPPAQRYAGQPIHVNIPVTVHSKKEVALQFPTLVKGDENINVTTSNEGVVVANRTLSFVTIDTISLYWGGRIVTKAGLNRELAPNSNFNEPYELSNFNLEQLGEVQPFKLQNVTRKTLESTQVTAGVAVKYRINDLDASKTILVESLHNGEQLAAVEVD